MTSFITDDVTTRSPAGAARRIRSPRARRSTRRSSLFNCPFTVNQRTNNGGGEISGFEVGATTPIGGGFGVQANYTYSDAEADNGDPIPGASRGPVQPDGVLRERAAERASVVHVSLGLLRHVRPLDAAQPGALESLEPRSVVNVLDNVALTFDGVNLTNEKIVQFATETFRPRAIYDNGRIYYAGVRMKF